MSAVPIGLGDVRFLADPSGALIAPERSLAVVADLHFEKGSSFARHGQLLPPYDTGATLARLEAVLAHYRPRRVISLGDAFHDRAGSARLADRDRRRLRGLTRAHDWLWLQGNHDPAAPEDLGGRAEVAVDVAGIVFRHQPRGAPEAAEVAGHLHPVARLHWRSRKVARPCFIADQRRLLLPAFGAYTGGLDVAAPAVQALFQPGARAYLLGRAVHCLPLARLVG